MRTGAAHRSWAHRDDSGRGHILRSFPQNEARFRAIGSGGVTGDADGGRRGVRFQLFVGKDVAKLPLRGCGKEEPRLPRNMRGLGRGRVPTGGGNDVMAEGSGVCFTSVLEGGENGELALTPAQMTTNLQTHLRATGTDHKRYTIHSFRVGGAASHNMDGTARDVLMEYVGMGWKSVTLARRYVGVIASAAAVGMKRSREMAFIEADAVPLFEQFVRSHMAFPGVN